MDKNINLYSDPEIVFKLAKQIYGKNVHITLSTRKDKKYMILDPHTNKYIHFGQMGYEDYTKHKNKERRHKFLTRNKRFKDYDMYTPAYMSYYLLW